MKKMILAAACAATSGSIFADSTEQRILLLENELQRLKTELKEQKQQQNVLQAQQQEDRALTQKINTSSWKDNVDFYGILRMDGAVDFKSTTGRSSGGRTSNKINSVPFDGVEGNRSDFTVAASRFGVDINHLGGRKDVKAKLEADFWVDSGKGDGKLRIRHAYVSFDDWLFGQTWSLMSNMETITESVDFTQLLGASILRDPQVRYQWQFSPAHTLQMALEYSGERTSEFPSLTSKYTYKNGPLHLMGQGFINEKQAQATTGDIEKVSWGVGAGAKYKFNAQQSVQANYYHVKGDQKFVFYTNQGSTSDNANWGGDFSVNTDNNEILLNEFDSLSIGYSHKFNDQWRANIATSLLQYDDNSAYAKANPESNKRLTDHVVNAFYTPVEHVDLGVEYHHGKRENFAGKEADISRVNMSARYKF